MGARSTASCLEPTSRRPCRKCPRAIRASSRARKDPPTSGQSSWTHGSASQTGEPVVAEATTNFKLILSSNSGPRRALTQRASRLDGLAWYLSMKITKRRYRRTNTRKGHREIFGISCWVSISAISQRVFTRRSLRLKGLACDLSTKDQSAENVD